MARRKRRHPAVEEWIQGITSKGGKARAAALTPSERKKIAAAGGVARWADVSATTRSARMRAVIKARWAKRKKTT